MNNQSYGRYYDIEGYLFETVTNRFRENHTLSAFDFFCIIIWKANRAKSKIAKKLKSKSQLNLPEAVAALTSEIASMPSNKERLQLLVTKWGFRLPMASAILTVLYPEVFTVYDVRVCGVLNDYFDAQAKYNFAALWERYDQYCNAVRQFAPQHLSLRDKDRWLWGKSFAEQLQSDIARNFIGDVETLEDDV